MQFFLNPMELDQAYPPGRPRLVLAIPPTMSYGPSRWLFKSMASVDGNVVLMTSRGEDGTLARELYTRWEREQEDTAKWGRGRIGHPRALEGELQLEVSCL